MWWGNRSEHSYILLKCQVFHSSFVKICWQRISNTAFRIHPKFWCIFTGLSSPLLSLSSSYALVHSFLTLPWCHPSSWSCMEESWNVSIVATEIIVFKSSSSWQKKKVCCICFVTCLSFPYMRCEQWLGDLFWFFFLYVYVCVLFLDRRVWNLVQRFTRSCARGTSLSVSSIVRTLPTLRTYRQPCQLACSCPAPPRLACPVLYCLHVSPWPPVPELARCGPVVHYTMVSSFSVDPSDSWSPPPPPHPPIQFSPVCLLCVQFLIIHVSY